MAQLKDLIVTGDSRVIGNNYTNNPKVAFGTCTTAAATAAKVVEVADPTWNLQTGNIIGVKFTNSNSASSVTLNVNGSGAKSIAYNTSYPYTGSSSTYTGAASGIIYYMFDGTYWVWQGCNWNVNSNTYTSALCTTAASTAAKTAGMDYYTASNNSYVHVNFRYANSYAGAITLNINSQGAKPVYINGSASSSTNYTLPAGPYIAYYDGNNYYFRTDGKLTASITGDAATVSGGYTVAKNVPSDAVFTDTKNTAGSTDSSSKLFIVGATSQAANPQTYSQDTAYVGTDGHLYSNSVQVVNLSGSQALTNKTYNGYTLGAACAKAVVTSVDTSASLPTSNAVKTFVEGKGYTTIVAAAYCNTAAGTAAKTASCTGYTLTANTYLHVIMVNANSSAGALTLSVNSKTAKPIYIDGAPSGASNYTLPAGTYLVFYDGDAYWFNTEGQIPGLKESAYHGVDTALNQGMTSDRLPTSAAVVEYINSMGLGSNVYVGTNTPQGAEVNLWANPSGMLVAKNDLYVNGTIYLEGTKLFWYE